MPKRYRSFTVEHKISVVEWHRVQTQADILSNRLWCCEESDQDSDEESKDVSRQDRFEAIWASLKMPEHQRLDMVIKHSTNDRGHVGQALDLWESAAQAVVKRESIISELELFERQASDPGRFFEKGTVGSSSYRLAEAKGREKLYKRLEPLEAAAQATVLLVQDKLGDTVTYEGRPYIEKIRFDRVEMLYWLQQERRREALVSKDLPPLVASKSNI
ncbi:coiled-coil domain-containing protein 87-like [Corticium candelabrum]|uniref:coiled-coil domain-containing protein 87-like n=1 Tax=Corticium candelabrum TaxID=121492 RepID=UPI002E25590E|nr:coiled-coil domain-containing protein 87-like [Corticium candelabrum]